MKKNLLQLLGTFLILVLLEQVVYADIPSPGLTPEEETIMLGALFGLWVLITIIVFVAALIIKSIKKKHNTTESTKSTPVEQ